MPLPATTSTGGFASVGLAVPFDLGLRGLSTYAQAVVLDPRGPFAGLAFSAAQQLVLGN